jgi:hypothetical protein
MIELKNRTANILQVKWTLPEGVADLFNQVGYPSAPEIHLADLIILVDKMAVAFCKISELSPGIIFDLNLNSLRTNFTIEAVILQQLSNYFTDHYADTIENSLINIPPDKKERFANILHVEQLKVSYTDQNVSCEVNHKSAKIDPDFFWLGDLSDGIDIATASELLETWKMLKPFYWQDKFLLGIRFDETLVSSEETAFDLPLHDNLFTSCPCVKHHGDATGVTRQQVPKCAIPAPVITPSVPGVVTYMYLIVAILTGGVKTSPSEIGITLIGPADLTVDPVVITWTAVTGAVSYEVHRVIGDLTCVLATVAAPTLTYTDAGAGINPAATSTDQGPTHDYVLPGADPSTFDWSVKVYSNSVLVCTKTKSITIRP